MGIRFRKSMKLAPGVRMNFSMSGISTSFGPRGATVSLGSRGAFLNTNLPGTGFYSRQRIGGSTGRTRNSRRDPTPALENTILSLMLDGTVRIEDLKGIEITGTALKRFREENEPGIRAWLEEETAKANADYEACIGIHHETPSPIEPPRLPFPIFQEEEPSPTDPIPVTWWDRLILRRMHIEELNAKALETHSAAHQDWSSRKAEFGAQMGRWRELTLGASAGDAQAMEAVLNEVLSRIKWPRETLVSFEFSEGSTTIDLDVDLPEIEDMPTEVASVSGRGIRINKKPRTDAQIRRDYAQLVHGIVLRVTGEIFIALPTVQQATISGRTQRSDPGSGQVLDDYVISVRIVRNKWAAIDFANIQAIDPVEALDRFELVRHFDRSRKLLTISPIGLPIMTSA